MPLVPVAPPLREAADSLVKASTPQPFSASKTSNWVARAGGLPDYIQHIAHGIQRSGHPESEAIEMAIGVCKNPPASWDANAHAACAKAIAEWEKMKGANAAKVKESAYPSAATLLFLERDAMARIVLLEREFGVDGMVGLLDQAVLAEAASSSWTPTLKRTASAPQELERHEVYDGGQHVGTIAARPSSRFDKTVSGPTWTAFALNGQRLTDYSGAPGKSDAVKAIQTHLEEAPARVIALPSANKFLVARPEAYSGDTSYKQYPSEAAARTAAGLPLGATAPERDSKVQAVAEMLRFDLRTISGVDVPMLRRVQEARRLDPFELAEEFNPDELRGFGGKWIRGAMRPKNVMPGPDRARVPSKSAIRYEGGSPRASAKLRVAHAAKPQIPLKQLKHSVGSGPWDHSSMLASTRMLSQSEKSDETDLKAAIKAGTHVDTETAHRTGPNGEYSRERQALHQRIIDNLLQGKQTHEGKARAIFTAGGPASGKSSLEKHGLLKVPNDVVHANPDVVREMLPEYHSLLAAGRRDAANLTHEESSYLAKLVTKVALGRQHHILVDTVGDSGPGKFAGKIKQAQRAGHTVSVHYVTIHSNEAVRRSAARAERQARESGQKIGRLVPEGFLREAHANVSARFPEVAPIPGIHLQVFDNNGRVPKLIAERQPKADNLRIVDARAHQAFLDKARR